MGIGLPLLLEGQRLSQRYRITLNAVKQAFACHSQVNRRRLPLSGHSKEMPVWPLFPRMPPGRAAVSRRSIVAAARLDPYSRRAVEESAVLVSLITDVAARQAHREHAGDTGNRPQYLSSTLQKRKC